MKLPLCSVFVFGNWRLSFSCVGSLLDELKKMAKESHEWETTSEIRMEALLEIFENITDEVERGNLVDKQAHLQTLLKQTPAEWFSSGLGAEESHKIAESCTKLIMLLVNRCQASLRLCAEEGAAKSGSDDQVKQSKEHARLAHAALSIIHILLTKLSQSTNIEETSPGRMPDSATGTKKEGGDAGIEKLSDKGNEVMRCTSAEEEANCAGMQMNPLQNRTGNQTAGSSGESHSGGHFSIAPHHADLSYKFPQEILDESSRLVEGIGDQEDEPSFGTYRSLKAVLKQVIGPSVVLCAAHAQKHSWTNSESRQAANTLLRHFMRMCGVDSVAAFLQGQGSLESRQHTEAGAPPTRLVAKGAFGPAMATLKQQLTRSDWKKNPAAKFAFMWLLAHIKHPYLGEYLDLCLPPSLLFVDDFKMENKSSGIQCLQHIIDNVDPTELRWYGRAEVIYEALQPLMHNHQPDLIGALYPCMLASLRLVERDPKKTDQPRELGRYDKALEVILTNMEGEQRISVHQANTRHLGPFLHAMGITILWHMKKLMRVIVSYLEASDGPEETGRILTLRVLQVVIVQAWPRMRLHAVEPMKALLKILVDLSRRPDETSINTKAKETVRMECIQCMILMKRCCGAVVTTSVDRVLGSSLTDKYIEDSLRQVLAG